MVLQWLLCFGFYFALNLIAACCLAWLSLCVGCLCCFDGGGCLRLQVLLFCIVICLVGLWLLWLSLVWLSVVLWVADVGLCFWVALWLVVFCYLCFDLFCGFPFNVDGAVRFAVWVGLNFLAWFVCWLIVSFWVLFPLLLLGWWLYFGSGFEVLSVRLLFDYDCVRCLILYFLALFDGVSLMLMLCAFWFWRRWLV